MDKALDKVDKQLQQLFEEQQQNVKIGIRIQEVNGKLTKLNKQVKARKSKLSKEKSDFERIEKYNTNKLFTAILGDREKQLEKERQEYLQAALEYNSVIDMIELLRFEQGIIETKYQSEEIIEKKLKKMILKKEKSLKKLDPKAANSIGRFDTKLFDKRLLLREMEEAENVGNYCVSLLNELITNLNKVKNWGYMDMSGRQYKTYSKRSIIEKSRILVANSNLHLDKFVTELSDVYTNLKVEFNIDKFDNFINIFFDNLITDWIIQQQIHNALNNITSVKDKVNRLLANLKSDTQKTSKKIEKIEKEKRLFVINL